MGERVVEVKWTETQYRDYVQKRLASEERTRTKIREKHETSPSVDTVVPKIRQRNEVPALDGAIKEQRQRKGRVAVRVTLILCRHRELDSDSAIYSLKPLRDAVAASFGLDDADARIAWHYGQQVGPGEQGVIVKIETPPQLPAARDL